MRLPHLSTGAWIFASVIAAGILTPTAVYAAASSTVAVGNTGNGVTAFVTSDHQLLTTPISPKDVIHRFVGATGGVHCTPVYTPPAGKAVVVTSISYDLGSGTAGTEEWAELTDSGCGAIYDIGDTTQGYDTQQHVFAAGVPMQSVGVYVGSNATAYATIDGYLVPASQLPAAAQPLATRAGKAARQK